MFLCNAAYCCVVLRRITILLTEMTTEIIKAIGGGVQGVKNVCFSANSYILENLSGFRNLFTELKNIGVAQFCGRFSAVRYA